MTDEEVTCLRLSTSDKRGLVAVLNGAVGIEITTPSSTVPISCLGSVPEESSVDQLTQMRNSLNSLAWEKVITHFGGIFPLAHFQICVNERWGSTLGNLFGISAGWEVMNDSANHLCLSR